uniref:Beta-glucosidase n=1 Tax=Kalanchoe fedtschenkoi TaxID=63787 RepID=A0A7N0VF79_KALFE
MSAIIIRHSHLHLLQLSKAIKPSSSRSLSLIATMKMMMSASSLLLVPMLLLSAISSTDAVFDSADRTKTKLDLGGLSREAFPEGFVFGTATSAFQVEGMANKGGRGPSIWDTYIKDNPGAIAGNATADVAVDQYHRYKEDVDLLAKLNFDAYRFSISWSRIFPNGTGKVNWEGVAYYNRLIDYLLEKGVTPYANLYHYDLPQALHDRYLGWLSPQIVKDYASYAEFCFQVFGGRVKNWITYNEPKDVAWGGYGDGSFTPARCSKDVGNCTAGNSGTEPYIVGHYFILAHATAVKIYREKYQAIQHGRIGLVTDFVWYEPLTRSKADNYAAQRARDFHLGWFLDPLINGEYPKTMRNIVGDRLPKFTGEEAEMVKGTFDFIGINHYTTFYTYDTGNQTGPLSYMNDWHAGFAYEKNGVPVGKRANSVWLYKVPWGVYKTASYIKERYGNPTIILSENGMDDPGNATFHKALVDSERMAYFRGYLQQLKRGIDEGANVIGYFAWSLLDNFEWKSGYTSRFGITYIDYKTLNRYPKMSAYWFRKMLARHDH